jgi:hypothetical protein
MMHKGGLEVRIITMTSAACAAVIAVSGVWLPAARAQADAKPSVNFSFVKDRVTQKEKLHITYSSQNLPTGSLIYLQSQVGSAHAWKNVERLPSSASTATAPGVSVGKYEYRLLVTTRKGAPVVASHPHALFSYGKIPFAALCQDYSGGPCTPSNIQIGNTIFTYVDRDEPASSYPHYSQFLILNSTSCRSLTLLFATDDTQSGGNAYVELVQSKANPKYAQTPDGTIGTLKGTLNGGPFALDETNDGFVNFDYFNGSANCYTLNGLP